MIRGKPSTDCDIAARFQLRMGGVSLDGKLSPKEFLSLEDDKLKRKRFTAATSLHSPY